MRHLTKKYRYQREACSQLSIAMALGCEAETVALQVGHWRGMSTQEILKYLDRKGMLRDATYNVSNERMGGVGILIINNGREGHAMAFKDGIIYDPNGRLFNSYEDACMQYSFATDSQWVAERIMTVAPVKTREWSVGV